MAQLEYTNTSINSLVQELNSLGNRSVVIQPSRLIAIQTQQLPHLRRFQSKSARRQFFKFQSREKKYFYDQVYSNISHQILPDFLTPWQNGYNSTLLFQNKPQILTQILKLVQSSTEGSLVFLFALDNHNQVSDLLGQKVITHAQLLQNKKYYEIDPSRQSQILTEYLQCYYDSKQARPSEIMIDLCFKDPQSCSQLRLIFLPEHFFAAQSNSPFSLIKTQLTQILNYIKMNPNKRYEHISKLITKRLPMTNYLTRVLMSDSYNLLANFLSSQSSDPDQSVSKFQFFDKMSIISNLIRKPDHQVVQLATIKPIFNQTVKPFSHSLTNRLGSQKPLNTQSNKTQSENQKIISPIGKLSLNDDRNSKKQKALELRQFEFCRSLQRKTHKFSISPTQQISPHISHSKFQPISNVTQEVEGFPNKKTINKFEGLSNEAALNELQLENKKDLINYLSPGRQRQRNTQTLPVSQAEQIVLLKAEHARQVSQYHQTIQLLNKKIMVLSKEKNLEELYKIHERQIMLLELKIKELRDDIILLAKDEPNENGMKLMLKKLTEQIKNFQTNSSAKKISQGRLLMLQTQLRDAKQKLTTSEKARAALALEVETLTKRLRIRDSQIQRINQEQTQSYQCEELSLTEEQIFQDIKKLVRAVKEQQRNAAEFLLRKVSLILSDLSKSRDIILRCNDFLVQLMETLDSKLSQKEPQIVLDCNKFIRSFLLQNLSIF